MAKTLQQYLHRFITYAFPGIRSRLFLLLIVILIPVLMIQVFIFYENYKLRKREAFQANLEIARSVAKTFDAFIQDVLHQAMAVGIAATATPSLSPEGIDRLLDESAEEYQVVRALGWAGPEGRVMACSDPDGIGLNLSDRSYFLQIASGEDWAVSNLILSLQNGDPVFIIARGVRDEAERLVGIVFAEVAPERLDRVLAVERFQKGNISILDRRGMLVYRYPPQQVTWEERDLLPLNPLIRNSLDGKEVVSTVLPAHDDERRIIANTPIPSIGWIASADRSVKESLAPITATILLHGALFLVVVFFSSIAALVLSQSILLPLKRLRTHALMLGRREKAGPIRPGGPLELHDLGHAFNLMAGQLQRWIGEAEQRAQKAEEGKAILDALMAYVPEGIAIATAGDGVIRMASRHGQELVRFPLTGISMYSGDQRWPVFQSDGITPVSGEDMPIVRAMRNGDVTTNEELILKHPDGAVTTLLCDAGPIRDGDGVITGGIVTWNDITERKRAQESLQKAYEENERNLAQLNALFNQMTEGLINFDPDGRLMRINRAALQIWGFENEAELLGSNYEQLKDVFSLFDLEGHPLAGDQWPFRRVLQGEVFQSYEVRVLCKDTGRTWIGSYGGTPVYDQSGRMIMAIATFRDVTRQHRAQEALRENREELRNFNRKLEAQVAERTEKVRRQSEQLRALAVQLSQVEQRERKRLAEILHDHIQQLLAAARIRLEAIRHNPAGEQTKELADTATGILKEAIAASRSLTVDLFPPVLQQLGLCAALEWLADNMAEKHAFQVHVRTDPRAEPAREEVRFFLFECVRELLFNVQKHSGVREAEVTVLRTFDNRVRIIVEDRGRGFDPEKLGSRERKMITFGIFSIQQRLAHMEGTAQIETSPGKGTRVTLLVPADSEKSSGEKVPEENLPDEAVRQIHVQERKERIRVMVVDDHKIVREGLVGLLQFESGLTVAGEAADGPQAIERARTLQPDVIVMDVNLGEMSGVDATRVILSEYPNICIIGLSMHSDREMAAIMKEAGAVAYLTKGGPAEELVEVIRNCRVD